MIYRTLSTREGFKGGTRGSPIMPRDAVSRTANVERTGRHKWDKKPRLFTPSCTSKIYSDKNYFQKYINVQKIVRYLTTLVI